MGLCHYDTEEMMRAGYITRRKLLAAAFAYPGAALCQSGEEFEIYAEHPRLLLGPRRLRLLKRERERQSERWQHFELLIKGRAAMPEPGFALGLYYAVAGDEAVGRRAVEWALTASDIRQAALVFDWCQPILKQTEAPALAATLMRALQKLPAPGDVTAGRSYGFAAIALASHSRDLAKSALKGLLQDWWRQRTAPVLKTGALDLPRAQEMPLFELLHAVRDTLDIQMDEDCRAFFKDLPASQLLSYFPAPYDAPESAYRIPWLDKAEPDLRAATFTRIAELSFVAYQSNATETQFLQGWLMHDRYLLRSPLGSPYEFLWANPYQPGLAYHHMPLFLHDSRTGKLFVRSTWEDDSEWFGMARGRMLMFRDGKPEAVKPGAQIPLGESLVLTGFTGPRFEVAADAPTSWFLAGLEPDTEYEIEVDDEEIAAARSDRAGILPLQFTRKQKLAVHLRPRA